MRIDACLCGLCSVLCNFEGSFEMLSVLLDFVGICLGLLCRRWMMLIEIYSWLRGTSSPSAVSLFSPPFLPLLGVMYQRWGWQGCQGLDAVMIPWNMTADSQCCHNTGKFHKWWWMFGFVCSYVMNIYMFLTIYCKLRELSWKNMLAWRSCSCIKISKKKKKKDHSLWKLGAICSVSIFRLQVSLVSFIYANADFSSDHWLHCKHKPTRLNWDETTPESTL